MSSLNGRGSASDLDHVTDTNHWFLLDSKNVNQWVVWFDRVPLEFKGLSMPYLNRDLAPVNRKPRSPKTIVKKLRKQQAPKPKKEKVMWSNSDIPQSYT
jgi:hypothetical protein